MVASLCWCALFSLVLSVNSVFCCSSFTRERFKHFRETTTPAELFPTFLVSAVEILEILVKGFVIFVHAVKCWRRGKHAAVLVRLCWCGLRPPLPGIFLSNLRSLCIKLEELQLLVRKNREFHPSSVLCSTETLLCGSIPDTALQLAGFTVFRADHDTELPSNTKGGGICFYINRAGVRMRQ